MHKEWCGRVCSDCSGCRLDERIPCSPDCENLTEDGKIKLKQCLESGCNEPRYIFDMLGKTDSEIIEIYGEVAVYPY